MDFSRLSPSSNGRKPFVVEGENLMNNKGSFGTDDNVTKEKVQYLMILSPDVKARFA